jgi:hypothetical protein
MAFVYLFRQMDKFPQISLSFYFPHLDFHKFRIDMPKVLYRFENE